MPQNLPIAEDKAQSTLGTVLIVDDDEINCLIATKGLEGHAQIRVAKSGAEALKIIASSPPQLILMDVMMPEMSGFDVAEVLRKDPVTRNIPIIFLTAMSDPASHRRGLSLGARDFLPKPIDLGVLRLRVVNLLERESLRHSLMEKQHQLQQALQQLTESHHLLEAIFNTSSEARIVLDYQNRIMMSDQNANTMFKGELSNLVGQNLDGVSFFDMHQHPIAIEDLLRRVDMVECIVELPHGGRLPVAIKNMHVTSNEQKHATLLTLRDISEQLKLKTEKRETDHRLTLLLAELRQQKYALDEHALVSITNYSGAITYVNEQLCAVSGYSADELLGQTHRILKSEMHSPEFYDEMLDTIYSGKTWHGEIANRAKDGSIYWVSSTIVPWLDADGMPYQYVAIYTNISDRVQAEEELRLARAHQLKISADIQSQLLFGKPPQHLKGLSISYFTEGSEGIDGDFYTFQEFNDTTLDVLTGDVMGKGVTAALIGAAVQNAYKRALVQLMGSDLGQSPRQLPSPALIVNTMHAQLTPEMILLGSFVTLILIRVNRAASTVTWVNAGHTPILLGLHQSCTVETLTGDNLPIGVLREEIYTEHVTQVSTGDTILLYSDGLSESMNTLGEQFGSEKISRILKIGLHKKAKPGIILGSLRSEIHNHMQFAVGGDDSTAVLVQLRSPEEAGTPSNIVSFDLPRQLEQLKTLRQGIEALCADQSEEYVQMLILAAFEAATNVIRHSPEKLTDSPLTVVLKREQDHTLVELSYVGENFIPTTPAIPDFSGDTTGGFGLYIIENSVDYVEYDQPMPGIATIRLIKNFSSIEPIKSI
jgi:phosphoserine phosphatase RsbU/P